MSLPSSENCLDREALWSLICEHVRLDADEVYFRGLGLRQEADEAHRDSQKARDAIAEILGIRDPATGEDRTR